MAIVPLNRITIYGTSDQKADVLDGLQNLGCLHLIDLRLVGEGKPEFVSKEARDTLRYLQSCSTMRRSASSKAAYDRAELIRATLAIKDETEKLQIERDHLKRSIDDLACWGEFSVNEIERQCGHQLWFYAIPLHDLSVLTDDLLWYLARQDNRFAYVVVLSDEQPTDFPYAPQNLDRRPLSQLRSRLDEFEERLDDLHWQRVALTRWRVWLKNDLDAADDAAARAAAAAGAIDDDTVFAIQGYVPRVANEQIREFCEQRDLALTVEPVGDDESAPTLLHNPKQVAGAEGCVTFYITPSYHAWDPTSVVFFSFSLFFAMIVADAGYGMVMALGLAMGWRKLSRTESTVRIRNLLIGIVVATIIYGVMVGSYFGVAPAPGTLPDKLRIRIDGKPMMENQTGMMVITVAIGVSHLVMANLISAWRSRRGLRWPGHLGWAMAMIGAFLIGGGALAEIPSLGATGKVVVVVGATAILLFSSNRPWTLSLRSIAMRLLDGVMQFANVSKAFGDVLSYLRLFALGLASAQLAITFNGLAADASHRGGIGLLAAILILIFGHTINFLLAGLGGVVHGLRLNCIEFFNWSLTEEGYAFQPFRRKSEN